jgi:hypothetical protein
MDQRGGAFRGPLQYMDTSYSMPASWTAGVNKAMPEPPTLARPGLVATGGRRRNRKTHKQSHRRRKHHGGFFSPSVMSPVLSNFGYIAPAVALAGYRYMEQVKSPRGGLSMKSLGLVKRRAQTRRRRSSKH